MKNAFAAKLEKQNGKGRIIQTDDGVDKRKSPVNYTWFCVGVL